MTTVNKLILVIDTILGVTLLAFLLVAKLPTYCMALAVFGISSATGMAMPLLFIESSNRKKKLIFALCDIALIIFGVMICIANIFVISSTVYLMLASIFVSLIVSGIAYNIENLMRRRAKKVSVSDINQANK